MRKRILALVLCAAMLFAGCGKSTGSTDNTGTGGETAAAGSSEGNMKTCEIHGITYEVPSDWQEETEESSEGVFYSPPGSNSDEIIIMMLYTDFKNTNIYTVFDEHQVYEKMIEGLSNTESITNLTEDYREINGREVGIARYVQSTFSQQSQVTQLFNTTQHFFAIPSQEGLLTCGYILMEGADDRYQDVYENILNSVRLPGGTAPANTAQVTAADTAEDNAGE